MPNSMPICSDANLVIRLVLHPTDQAVSGLWKRWRADRRQIVAPLLLRYEVANALHRLERAGALDPHAQRAALVAALSLNIQVHAEEALHAHALDFAACFSLPAAYDAHYLALAEREGAEFWTTDRCLAHTVRRVLPWVHLVEELGQGTP